MQGASFRQPKLVACSVRQTEAVDSQTLRALKVDRRVNIVSRTEDALTLRAVVKTYFDPTGPFEIETEVEGRVGIPKDVSSGELEEIKGYLAISSLTEASLVVGFLTKSMGVPVILPAPMVAKQA